MHAAARFKAASRRSRGIIAAGLHGSQASAELATATFLGVRYCCGFNPSATNWRHHSAGESRSCAMLMSRGRRPTAARTSLGARKAAKRQRPRRSPSRRFRTVAQPVICDGPIFGRNAGSYCSVESLRHFDPAGCGHSHTVPRCCAFPTLS